MSDDFYIGYRKEAPPALARFVRIVAVVITLTAIAIAGGVGIFQEPGGDGTYYFGARDWFMAQMPPDMANPALMRSDLSRRGYAPALLVGQGKHGPPNFLTNALGQTVQFSGARIHRNGVEMVEVGPERDFSVLPPPSEIPHSTIGALRDVTIEGELIDTKCFLGVMKPGHGKVHRGCASLCLKGGVPPGLAIRDHHGSTQVIVLNTGIADTPAIDPEWAGRIVRVSGSLEYFSGLPILRVREIALR